MEPIDLAEVLFGPEPEAAEIGIEPGEAPSLQAQYWATYVAASRLGLQRL